MLHEEKNKLGEERILEILLDISLAMNYLHFKNICHCDLKS